jgi:hypothetical protein
MDQGATDMPKRPVCLPGCGFREFRNDFDALLDSAPDQVNGSLEPADVGERDMV